MGQVAFKEFIDTPTKTEYWEYLQTDHWKSVKKKALVTAGFKCQLCSSKFALQVHHNNYFCLWCETTEDVIVLCQHCHERFHGV